METNEGGPAAAGQGVAAGGGHVHVSVDGERIEVRFGRGFTRADLEAVKSIHGREWVPARFAWRLPRGRATLATLARTFGRRLVIPASLASEMAFVAAHSRAATGVSRGPGAIALPAAVPREASADVPGSVASESVAARSPAGSLPDQADAVLEAMRGVIRTREYSRKTERAYLGWVRRFFVFSASGAESVDDLGPSHAEAFLEHLATTQRLAAKSRNQAASALTFMFRDVMGREDTAGIPRAKGPQRMPLVLSHREVLRVLHELVGKYFLVGVLLYSAGLRVEECLRIRVKDIDFELRQILVRDGKGRKDRYVPLARRAIELLRAQISKIREMHEKERAAGHGWAPLTGALHRKDPGAGYEIGWQWIFPASTINTDPATGRTGRWPLHVTAVQREMKRAVRQSGITKRATCHTLRHSFATEALRGGCDIRTLQHVMGHKDIRTTMIYLHVVEQTGNYMRSPLDRPDDPEDHDLDPAGRPWTGVGSQWDLGARQWAAGQRGGRAPERGVQPERGREPHTGSDVRQRGGRNPD